MDDTSFISIISNGSVQDIIDQLERGANPNGRNKFGLSALGIAATTGNVEKVLALIDAGADASATDAQGNSPLCSAVGSGHAAIVELLLDRGADINGECDCGPALSVAVLGRSLNMIPLLISRGANIDQYNHDGFTALMLAAGNGVQAAIPMLLASGSGIDLRDRNHGLTAYLHAALVGDTIAGKMLYDAGADITIVDNDGKTAATLAFENGHDGSLFDRY